MTRSTSRSRSTVLGARHVGRGHHARGPAVRSSSDERLAQPLVVVDDEDRRVAHAASGTSGRRTQTQRASRRDVARPDLAALLLDEALDDREAEPDALGASW